MFRIELVISNQECAALDAELTDVETRLVNTVAGHLPDAEDTATPAYMVLTRLLGPIRTHLERVQALEVEEAQRRREKYEARQARG